MFIYVTQSFLIISEALFLISDFVVNFPAPFYNLKYVELPKECPEASISSSLRSYLLDGSPPATIVTMSSLPRYTRSDYPFD